MDKNEALQIVKEQLTESRYKHTLGVRKTALYLAERFDIDYNKVEMAAILHDYAKYRPVDEMRELLRGKEEAGRFIAYGDELLHAPAGAYFIQTEAGIADADIVSSIYWHTTGKPDMTAYEKVLFLADYIEPNRTFPGVEEVREAAESDIDAAIVMALGNTIQFLISKNVPVFPDTLAAYNDLVMERK
ncbi:bis(5'-nucleosyl)-tetraphosphatase (symmetrical) YqeK [Marinococcus sp. PL1-022]|uniref:bis(5'-nucleosyl)-tetraphosphatase (symmetrical) YqeK n=1 Tax=Marinococcus sp. PL1-022 TaxID=3095363 RepID=UPI0029C33693|nr:bis(5'-nucleosyl)-tetraphosphatase (symmetrical) YqeK [Marinococcus sp. PL1-022]MDX6153353.1 bis(5'-nucleosyl)-tetraphosphatase (symmetrical) YqeK [Marinococcus sp. PL1-022]